MGWPASASTRAAASRALSFWALASRRPRRFARAAGAVPLVSPGVGAAAVPADAAPVPVRWPRSWGLVALRRLLLSGAGEPEPLAAVVGEGDLVFFAMMHLRSEVAAGVATIATPHG